MRVCAGCGDKIIDRFLLLALDQYWHVNCLKCSCCEARLGEIGTSCYSKGGMILCKTDYVRYVEIPPFILKFLHVVCTVISSLHL